VASTHVLPSPPARPPPLPNPPSALNTHLRPLPSWLEFMKRMRMPSSSNSVATSATWASKPDRKAWCMSRLCFPHQAPPPLYVHPRTSKDMTIPMNVALVVHQPV
jgi:hypothetical protein